MDAAFASCTIEVPMSEWTVDPPMDSRDAGGYAQYWLGVRHYRSHRWDEAAEEFQKALEIDPHRGEVRLALGACLLHLDRPEEAMSHFDRAASGALSERALFGKAVALQRLGRFREAEAAYTRVLVSDARNKEALSNLIALYAASHDFENVRRYASRLVDVAPESMAALQGLAAASLESLEYESAFRYCSRIVERWPECVEAWHNLRLASGHVESTLRMAAAASQSTSQSTGRK
jgi:protein O-mannosyl-transferase